MDLGSHLSDRIAAIAGVSVTNTRPLGGGCIADVRRIDLADGRRWVAKIGQPGAGLALEGFMLKFLADNSALPVPTVHHAEDDLLLLEWIACGDTLTQPAQRHAGALIAALHDAPAPAFGFSQDTVIGGLPQPNAWSGRWIPFFRDQRLLFMAGQAREAGRLPADIMARIEKLAGRIDRWIDEPGQPSLIHGDLWGGNVLCRSGRIAAFVDPAIYYADPEIELAFGTLFGTFGPPFFDAYRQHRNIAAGFFETRRDLYNLYPLLVHVRLFGDSYLSAVERTLHRFGA